MAWQVTIPAWQPFVTHLLCRPFQCVGVDGEKVVLPLNKPPGTVMTLKSRGMPRKGTGEHAHTSLTPQLSLPRASSSLSSSPLHGGWMTRHHCCLPK